MLGNNLSQLGINARQLTRDMATSLAVWWLPTTGEFGPRGGFGDFEDHQDLALRLGAAWTHARENALEGLDNSGPENTQIRLADSINVFLPGSLAAGVSVQDVTYDLADAFAGLKWHGFFLQAEFYARWLTDFFADGPLPVDSLFDWGFYAEAAMMVWPKHLELYGETSFVFGDQSAGFGTQWEVLGGLNVFPFARREMRINAQVIYVDRSPVDSLFGYYIGGQSGTTLSVAAAILF
jgi:hypothetical protein